MDSRTLLNQGHVQVYRNGLWSYVCDTEWADNAGNIACRWLGFHSLTSITTNTFYNITNNANTHWASIVCDQSDYNNFSSCNPQYVHSGTCLQSKIAGIICDYEGK